jgi:hypothetical protein
LGAKTALKEKGSLIQTFSRPVFPETVMLIAICIADMASTLWAVRMGKAAESNPVLATSLATSNAAFVALKTALCLGPVILLELIGRYKPSLVRNAIRSCLFGYICIYVFGIIAVRVFHQ